MAALHAVEDAQSSTAQPDRASDEPRTLAQRRAERATARGLTAGERPVVAVIVRDVVLAHREAGRPGLSNRALADRLGIDEKEIRERLEGLANWPLHHVARLPRRLARDVFAQLAERAELAELAAPSRPLATHAMRVGAAAGRLLDEVALAEADGPADAREERAIDLRALDVVGEITALRRDRLRRGVK